ncbi:uncharacterized protein PV09_09481 [Verruconis gallopava]|uniref:Uncharacterized protein n=1 Tax=Verruconis gallopava TaxID=253628 RepID=A0A0D1ZXF3_9PEZI|nr:uncharacterized protein PV09_09481 [Verruconis gallopava]KIV98749.1 hypothetical protein PV09_09481 [Verruconis gallopava]
MQEVRSNLNRKIACPHLRPLKLVEALNSKFLEFRHGSPWDYYTPVGEPYLDGEVKIIDAQLQGPTAAFVTIQSTKLTPAVRQRLTSVRKLIHENLSTVREVFICNNKIDNEIDNAVEDVVHVVFESFPISLADIAGHADLTEARLTTILAQVSCSIRPCRDGNCKDVQHLGRVTMKLMQGYEKETGAIGLDKPKGWSAEALTFLSDTTSMSSVQQLAKVGPNMV